MFGFSVLIFHFLTNNDHLMVCPAFGSCVNVAVYVFIELPCFANDMIDLIPFLVLICFQVPRNLCLKNVLQIFRLFLAQNSNNSKPFSFLIPVPKFPRTLCHSFVVYLIFQLLHSNLHIYTNSVFLEHYQLIFEVAHKIAFYPQ